MISDIPPPLKVLFGIRNRKTLWILNINFETQAMILGPCVPLCVCIETKKFVIMERRI